MDECKISVNSILSMGATDGPGIRSVIFLQGCKLRCKYCHNPETWKFCAPNTKISEIVEKVSKFKAYFGQKGGVTISGGEPLSQYEELLVLCKVLKEKGINIALDTSASDEFDDRLFSLIDLVLLDFKFLTDEEYIKYTSRATMKNVIKMLEKTMEHKIPVWIRHVVVPDVTDNEKYILEIKNIAKSYWNVEKIELLPFKKLCQSKYDELKIDFPMKNSKEIKSEEIAKLRWILLD